MNKSLSQLAIRKQRIKSEVAAQRHTLAQCVEPWRIPLAVADQGITAIRYLKHHPTGVVSLALLLVAIRPRRIISWLEHGWVSWQLLQSIKHK